MRSGGAARPNAPDWTAWRGLRDGDLVLQPHRGLTRIIGDPPRPLSTIYKSFWDAAERRLSRRMGRAGPATPGGSRLGVPADTHPSGQGCGPEQDACRGVGATRRSSHGQDGRRQAGGDVFSGRACLIGWWASSQELCILSQERKKWEKRSKNHEHQVLEQPWVSNAPSSAERGCDSFGLSSGLSLFSTPPAHLARHKVNAQ